MSISFQHIKSLKDTSILGQLSSPINGVSIDSRTTVPGNLFIAFKGQTADGHSYIPNAISHGAAAVMASDSWRERDTWDDSLPLILSKIPEKSLGELATLHRQDFDIPVIAITGSNGKTTTKDLLSYILSAKHDVLATKGNFNNQLGLPMSLLDLNNNHSVAIIEMGASKPNDISELCEIAHPNIGLITNIAFAHTEFFKTLDGVLMAKKALFDAIPENGTIFLNADDKKLRNLNLANKTIISFGQKCGDNRFKILKADRLGRHRLFIDGNEIQLDIQGDAFPLNVAAAWYIARYLGISAAEIIEKLHSFSPTPGRMQQIIIRNVHFIHDAYNANPQSMKSALKAFSKMKSASNKILVLADMLELGSSSEIFHSELIPFIKDSGAHTVFLIGKNMSSLHSHLSKAITNIYTGQDVDSLKNKFLETIQTNDIILLKGSNSFHLDKLLNIFREA
mgnify:CR=1 FL=1|jgi:UDP-N-acetylmuramoyl-tripeptide--D-alanyl-D-alanine ligase